MTNAATNVAPTEANVASAGHLNLHQAACETAKSPVTLIVKEAEDGDSDAVWATTAHRASPGVAGPGPKVRPAQCSVVDFDSALTNLNCHRWLGSALVE